MSVNANYVGEIQRPAHLEFTGSSKTTLGSPAVDRSQTLASFSFVNPTAGAVTCELYWYDGTADRLIWRKIVPANDTVIEANMPVRLLTGNVLKAVAANTVTITLFYSTAYPLQ